MPLFFLASTEFKVDALLMSESTVNSGRDSCTSCRFMYGLDLLKSGTKNRSR